MDQPAADREAADTSTGEQRARGHRRPRERPAVTAGHPVEEEPEEHHEADARGELERHRRRRPRGADGADLADDRSQARHG